MARKSIKKNYIYNLCYQILLFLTPMITTPYISRVLGAKEIGRVSYAESIVSYFTLFAAIGISTYGQREISYVQDDIIERSIVFWNTKTLEFCTSFSVFLIFIVFSLFQDNTLIYIILSLNILAVFADVTWFFQGMEDFEKIVIRNVIFKVINIIYVFLVIHSEKDVLWYTLGLSLFLLLSNISLWGYIPKYVKKIDRSRLNPFKDFRTVISLFIPTIAMQVYTVLDKTMIGLITQNAYQNGYYEQALKITKIILTMVTALGTVMIPRIGYYFERGDSSEINRLMYRGYRFVWFLGIPLCIGLILVSDNFVPWFFGAGYDQVIGLLKILSILILAIGINNVTGMQYLLPTKRQNIFTITVVIGAIINFVMNLILISVYQSAGAAIASVTAEMSIAIIQIIFVKKELSPLRILKEGFHYYFAGIVMAIVLFLLKKMFDPSAINTIILIICGSIVYFFSLLIIKDEFLCSNISIMLKKIGESLKKL